MEAFRAFIKPFEGQQRSEKKISVKFLSSSEIRTGRVKNVITFKSWIKKFLRFWNRLVNAAMELFLHAVIISLINSEWSLPKTLVEMGWLLSGRKFRVSNLLYNQLPRDYSFFGTNNHLKVGQKVISKWGSFDTLLFQSGTSAISKWSRDSYFK